VTHLSDNVTSLTVSPDSRLYAVVAVSDQDGRPMATVYTIPEDGTQTTRIATSARGGEGEEGGGGPGRARLINSMKLGKAGRYIFCINRDGKSSDVIRRDATEWYGGRAS